MTIWLLKKEEKMRDGTRMANSSWTQGELCRELIIEMRGQGAHVP